MCVSLHFKDIRGDELVKELFTTTENWNTQQAIYQQFYFSILL